MKSLGFVLLAVVALAIFASLSRPKSELKSPERLAPMVVRTYERGTTANPEILAPATPPSPKPKVWPPVEQRLESGPPPVPKAVAKAAAPPIVLERPTLDEVVDLASWKLDEPETLARARALLLDERRGPGLKLATLEKIRRFPAAEAVPLLAEYLGTEDPAGAAVTKPSALALLFEIDDPLARQALAHVQANSRDAEVLKTLEALQKRGQTR